MDGWTDGWTDRQMKKTKASQRQTWADEPTARHWTVSGNRMTKTEAWTTREDRKSTHGCSAREGEDEEEKKKDWMNCGCLKRRCWMFRPRSHLPHLTFHYADKLIHIAELLHWIRERETHVIDMHWHTHMYAQAHTCTHTHTNREHPSLIRAQFLFHCKKKTTILLLLLLLLLMMLFFLLSDWSSGQVAFTHMGVKRADRSDLMRF